MLLWTIVRDHLPGVRVTAPEGTYLAWLDCRNSPAAEQPYQFFLTRAKVALSDGLTFGPGGEGPRPSQFRLSPRRPARGHRSNEACA
jgi:cystathionine beta-lyase